MTGNTAIHTGLAIGLLGLLTSIWSAPAQAADATRIGEATVEMMPSTDVIRFSVAPAKDKYETRVVCGNDSIRVRLNDVGAESTEIRYLEIPRGSALRKVRLVPQLQNKSVVQIHTRGMTLEACERTTVMAMDGSIVVSVALTDAQKRRRMMLMNAKADSEKLMAAAEAEGSSPEAAAIVASQSGDASKGMKTATSAKPETEKSKKSLTGTIFDKSKNSGSLLETDEETSERTMKYAGGLLFAAALGFMAWYTKKRKNRFQMLEDSIDILSSKKVSPHQTLMVARVNDARFLLAVGDKAVTSLGLIPADSAETAGLGGLRENIGRAVKESLAREPRISATPYSEIKDEPALPLAQPEETTGFGTDFQLAIEKIARDRDKMERKARPRVDARTEPQMKPLSDAFTQSEISSNVSGLISMARMRAALEHRTSSVESDFRA